jgi:hypothetical protein
MMSKTKDNSLLPTLLLVLFIGLKLTGYITWSWWWVMSPLWIPLLIAILFIGYIIFDDCIDFIKDDFQLTMSDKPEEE